MKEIGNYNGGKSGSGTYQQIINLIPPHGIYLEPFAGHGGIFRKKRYAALSILNDLNKEVTDRWLKLKIPDCIVYENLQQGYLFEKESKPIVIVKNGSYEKVLDKFINNPQAFIYIDPPYVMNARKSQQRLYKFEWETDDQHIELFSKIDNAVSAVMISSNINPLYESMYKHWHCHKFKSMTRAGMADEIIYMNYKPPEVLHDVQYLGNNYRQRDNIKRKMKRWRERLQRLPQQEKIALLSDIINTFKETSEKIIQL